MKEIELKKIAEGGDIEDTDGAWIDFEIFSDGEKAGDVSVKVWDDGSCLIERIDIDEDKRGQGIGSAAIKEIAYDHDKTFIVPDNADAARLYARIGSETSSEVWQSLDAGFGAYEV